MNEQARKYVEVSSAYGERCVLVDEAEWRAGKLDLSDEVKHPSVRSPWRSRPTYEELQQEVETLRQAVTV